MVVHFQQDLKYHMHVFYVHYREAIFPYFLYSTVEFFFFFSFFFSIADGFQLLYSSQKLKTCDEVLIFSLQTGSLIF